MLPLWGTLLGSPPLSSAWTSPSPSQKADGGQRSKRVPLPGPTHPLGGPLRTCHFGPTRESLPHLFAVLRRGQQMPSGSEVLGNGSIRGQKALGMPRRLKPLHAPFPLACGPMRVLTPVVQITTLAMLYLGQDLPLGRAVALQLIGDDDPRDVLQPLEQLAEKLLRDLAYCDGSCTRMSRTLSSWSTERHRSWRLPLIVTNISSKCDSLNL